jgi:hypothetical protein
MSYGIKERKSLILNSKEIFAVGIPLPFYVLKKREKERLRRARSARPQSEKYI